MPRPPKAQTDATAERLAAYGIDRVAAALLEGRPHRDIAAEIGVTASALHYWMAADPERAKRCEAALRTSAESFAEKAEEVLFGIQASSTQAEVSRARELAQHYRWCAAVRNPHRFSDKKQVEVTGKDGAPLQFERIERVIVDPQG